LIAALEGLRGALVTLLADADLEPDVWGLNEAEASATTVAKGAIGDKGALNGEVGMGAVAVGVPGVLLLLLLTMGSSGKERAKGVVGDNGDIWRDGD
jgi:hypothetical protein